MRRFGASLSASQARSISSSGPAQGCRHGTFNLGADALHGGGFVEVQNKRGAEGHFKEDRAGAVDVIIGPTAAPKRHLFQGPRLLIIDEEQEVSEWRIRKN